MNTFFKLLAASICACLVFDEARAENDPESHCTFGVYLSQKLSAPTEDVVASCKKAAAAGYPAAEASLGWLHETGRGVEKDMNKAASLYFQAASKGDDFALDGLKRTWPTLVDAALLNRPNAKAPAGVKTSSGGGDGISYSTIFWIVLGLYILKRIFGRTRGKEGSRRVMKAKTTKYVKCPHCDYHGKTLVLGTYCVHCNSQAYNWVQSDN